MTTVHGSPEQKEQAKLEQMVANVHIEQQEGGGGFESNKFPPISNKA